MLGSECFAKMVSDYGLTHVFNVEAVLRLSIKEMEKAGLTAVMAHSEGAACYMADGYARVSGRPGLCLVQAIGAGNLVGGVHEAWLANSPVIAVTGKKPPLFQYKNSYQEADHRLFYEAVTKFNAEVAEVRQLPHVLRQCFREATTGKCRPVHFDVLNNIGRDLDIGEVGHQPGAEPEFGAYPAVRSAAPDEAVKKASVLLAHSERPIMVVGRGAVASGAGDALLRFGRKNDIPLVTTPDGKTSIDEDDPLWSGIVGGYGMACANQSVVEADLVIFVGTQTSDQTTCDWTVPAPGVAAIQIDIDPAELGRSYPNAVGLGGDARTVLLQLADAVPVAKRDAWRKQVAANLSATLVHHRDRAAAAHPGIRPERLCLEVEKALPADAVLVSDTGYSAIWTSTMIRMKASQIYRRAAGSLGWAFPAALGAKCAAPHRPVVCFTGDGGLFYHLCEMETAVRCGINTVTVVNNNQMLSQCAEGVKSTFGPSANPKYCFSNLNLSDVAAALGANAVRVTQADDIGPAIANALASNRPSLIEVMTDGAIHPQPPK